MYYSGLGSSTWVARPLSGHVTSERSEEGACPPHTTNHSLRNALPHSALRCPTPHSASHCPNGHWTDDVSSIDDALAASYVAPRTLAEDQLDNATSPIEGANALKDF